MFKRSIIVYSTPIIQLLIGLCIGIAFSIILSPFREQTDLLNPVRNHVKPFTFSLTDREGVDNGATRSRHIDEHPSENEIQKERNNLDYNINSDDYEPRLKVPPVKGQTATIDKSRRPRYISTELGIREKLFVAVLTSRDSLDSLGVAANKTVSQYVTKTVFFMNSRKPTLPSGMSLVVFNEEVPRLTGLQMLAFIGKQYVKSYDWFLVVRDTTYVRAKKLFQLVSNTSITLDVVVGHPLRDNDPLETRTYCDLGAGILLSQNMMLQVVNHLDWCQENLCDHKPDVQVGKCIRHGTDHSCSNWLGNKFIHFVRESPYKFTLDNHQKVSNRNRNRYAAHMASDRVRRVRDEVEDDHTKEKNAILDALTVSEVQDEFTMYKLHRYFCEHDLIETENELERLKVEIEKISYHTPNVNLSLSWPLGADPPTQPLTRFDVIRWEYFTETHIYMDGIMNNMKELKGVDKEDVNDVIKVAMEMFSKKYNNQFAYHHLVNGYRRFDSTRGMDYLLDLGLYDRSLHKIVTRRIKLLRPLGYVELVPMPYVTENSRVNLILPVTADNRDSVVSFLDSYAHTCLESGDNTYLFVVFIYEGEGAHVGENDKYSVLKSMISFYENKYQNGARIAWTSIQNISPSRFNIMDTISRKFSPESLFLLCTVGMDLSIEFLNRVRMNTIANWQVFFPIGFWQYKPNLAHSGKPYPTTIQIDRKVGHFDPHSFVHASFYNSDYQYARKQMISTSASKDIDLFEMFIKYHTLHMFRAVEPALKLSFRELTCDPRRREDEYHRCLLSRGEGLASQAQLAMLIFEHQQKLDQLQMNVMHQQNGPNVGQMKPDMLR